MRPTWTWVPGVLSLIALVGLLVSARYLLAVGDEEAGRGIILVYGFAVVSFVLFAVSGGMTLILAKPTGARSRLARRIGLLLFCVLNMAVGVLMLVTSGMSMFALAFVAVGAWSAYELVKAFRPTIAERSGVRPE